VHTGVRTTHHKEVWLSESDYLAWFQPPPATEPVTVIVPVLNRPDNVRPLVESLQASTGLAEILFVVEEDDKAELDAIREVGASYHVTKRHTFAEKVNDAWPHTGTPWIMLAGDDVRFRPGWLNHAAHVARVSGADVVGTNDLGNPWVTTGHHATHMLIRSEYVREVGASWDGPGIVCHEGYRHNFVDNEIVMAAKQRGTWAPSLGAIVEHLHPAWKKNTSDDVYALGNESYDKDQKLFESRLKAQHVAV
jgi:glycosyltransferase involved in cell wall biosynthesis